MGRGQLQTYALAQRSRPKHYIRWTPTRIRAELELFIAQRRSAGLGSGFPSKTAMEKAGRGDLAQAIRRYGGVSYWAAELGIQLAPGQDKGAHPIEKVLEDVRELVAVHGVLPSPLYLRRMGYRRLSSFIAHYPGGAPAFRRDYGIPGGPRGRLPGRKTWY